MLGWQQCGFLWTFVVLTFAVPLVRSVAVRLMASLLGGMVFVIFLALNAFNHAPIGPGQTVEYYGYPYTYYDNRDASFRLPRNGSARIPGERWNSDARVCPPSLFGNVAVFLFGATVLAWPICALELVMKHNQRKRTPDDKANGLHERPSWAR
jgi:hypothetical protein